MFSLRGLSSRCSCAWPMRSSDWIASRASATTLSFLACIPAMISTVSG
jgi:hypothetical protein